MSAPDLFSIAPSTLYCCVLFLLVLCRLPLVVCRSLAGCCMLLAAAAAAAAAVVVVVVVVVVGC